MWFGFFLLSYYTRNKDLTGVLLINLNWWGPPRKGGIISFISGGQKNALSKKEGNRLTKVISGSREQKIKILSLGKRENPKIFCETMDQVPPPLPTREGLVDIYEALPGVGVPVPLYPWKIIIFPCSWKSLLILQNCLCSLQFYTFVPLFTWHKCPLFPKTPGRASFILHVWNIRSPGAFFFLQYLVVWMLIRPQVLGMLFCQKCVKNVR